SSVAETRVWSGVLGSGVQSHSGASGGTLAKSRTYLARDSMNRSTTFARICVSGQTARHSSATTLQTIAGVARETRIARSDGSSAQKQKATTNGGTSAGVISGQRY